MKQIGDTNWDAVIIGAGPAGTTAAALLAQRAFKVLLVEKSDWPRDKVCGGCLSATATAALSEIGINLTGGSAVPLDRIIWHVANRSLKLPAAGAAILRSDLDARLVSHAQSLGCTFLPAASATLLPGKPADRHRVLALRGADETVMVQAAVVLAADGIGGTSLANEPWAVWDIDPNAWIGIATTCVFWPPGLQPGAVHMHIGDGGYVGLVQLADHRVHLAAALNPAASRAAGGPAPLIKQILAFCGRSAPPGFSQNRFRGTPELSRLRDQIGGHRILAVGDACGYIEPFTGEGIAWSIAAANAAADLLPAPADLQSAWPADLPAQWFKRHAQVVRRRQRACRILRPIMHHPTLAGAAVTLGRALPMVGRLLASSAGQIKVSQPALQGEAG